MSRIEQVESLFHQALALPAGDERARWVESHCGDDGELRAEVLSLLEFNTAMEEEGAKTPAAPSFIPTGRFGAYQAIELLAQGGMSSVYRAERIDGGFQQVVALKVMAAYLADPEFLRRFDTERQLLAALSHNNITRLLDGGVSSTGDPFLVTEFVQGETIDRYCDRRKLSLDDRLRLFLQVCDAVDHAHRNLIVHRDLKPGNILVNEEGTVKLLDFGTASMMAARPDVTMTRMRMLTPRYASPEQLRGERVSTATDIFSLGVILYELMAGAWPFGDPTSVVSGFSRAVEDVPAKPPATVVTAELAEHRSVSHQQLARMLDGDPSAIVLKALETDPVRRYESVLAFAADIGNYLDGNPVLARAQTPWYRAQKFLRRRWLPATAAAIFILGLLAATLFATHQATVARAEARKAERISQFLNDMLSSASSMSFEPRKFTVAQMLDAALPQLEKSWRDDPLVEATLRNSLASSYIAVHSFDEAKVQLDKALATFRSLGNLQGEASTLLTIASLYQSTGQTEESVRYYRSALEKFNRLGKEAPHLLVFRLKRNLAYTLYAFLNRDLAEARRLIAEALDLAAHDSSIPPLDVVTAQCAQAAMFMEEGKNVEAEAMLLRALEAGRKEEDGRGATSPLTHLVVLNSRKRNYAAARDYASELYRLILGAVGPEHESTASAEVMWARFRAETGEVNEAVAQVQEAMKVLLKIYPPLSANLWQPMTGAASVLNHAGRYQEAEAYARQLIAQCDAEHLKEGDARRGESLSRLGDSLLGQHRNREALEVLERAALGYEHAGPSWTKRAEELRSLIQETRKRTGE